MSPLKFIHSLQGIFFLFMISAPLLMNGQITVNNTVNAVNGVQTVLLGDGVTVTNITFSGNADQIGSFNCSSFCNLNLANGLVMGSGNIDQVPGNGGGNSSLGPAAGLGASDPDLVILSGFSILNDAAVLQFDFVPTGDSLQFNFVFGSDEYPEFVLAGYNDAFGFFISGPGISGPYSNNAQNIALLPNGITPVTIDNVNSGLNSQYYVNNNLVNSTLIECDGFTTVLTVSAQVQCGQTYHIKLAIADAGDTLVDSFVFLEGGSFESNQLSLQFNAPNLSPVGGGVYEGCDTANLTFTRPAGQTPAAVYGLQYSGTAINGIDFETLPTQLVFEAGQITSILPITAIPDAILEGAESFTVTVTGTGCNANTNTIVIGISDLPDLQVTIPDVIINCGQQALLTPQVSGGLGNYLVYWEDTNLNASTLSTCPNQPTSYNFVVSDTCGVTPFNGVANVVFIQNAPIIVDAGLDIQTTCLDQVDITPIVSGGFGSYTYNWYAGSSLVSNNTVLNYNGNNDVVVELIITDACNVVENDLVQISYPAMPINLELGPNQSVTCIDQTIILPVISGGIGEYNYQWSTQSSALGNASQLNFSTPENATVVLDVNDQCGNIASDQVIFDVPQISVLTDLGNDLSVTCLDANVIQGNTTGGVGQYTYSWLLNDNQVGSNSSYNMQVAQNSILVFTAVDECGNSSGDEINISVPPVPVMVDLGVDIVTGCVVPNIIAANATGGIGQYTYAWSDAAGSLTGNATTNYQTIESSTVSVSVTDQCGNTNSDQIFIEVPDVPIEITLTEDSTICKNFSIQLTGSATGGVGMLAYQWEQTQETMSSITVSPETSTLYTFMAADACGNSAEKNVYVTVYEVIPLFSAEYIDDNGLEFTNQTSQDLQIEWSFNDGDFSYEQNPTHYFLNSDEWTVTLTASGLSGCTKSVTQTYYPLGNIFIPTCFTPDNNGVNDFFFAQGHDLRHFEIWIYGRNGEEIFHTEDINLPWDGSHKGKDHFVPNGVYNYRLVAIGKRENTIEKAGHILIIR